MTPNPKDPDPPIYGKVAGLSFAVVLAIIGLLFAAVLIGTLVGLVIDVWSDL